MHTKVTISLSSKLGTKKSENYSFNFVMLKFVSSDKQMISLALKNRTPSTIPSVQAHATNHWEEPQNKSEDKRNRLGSIKSLMRFYWTSNKARQTSEVSAIRCEQRKLTLQRGNSDPNNKNKYCSKHTVIFFCCDHTLWAD